MSVTVRLSKKDARGMIGMAVRELFLARFLAVRILVVWHVMLEDRVAGGAL